MIIMFMIAASTATGSGALRVRAQSTCGRAGPVQCGF